MVTAYYNEHDPRKARYLRNLISAGLIAPGEVDERSIEDVIPTDLMGFDQCHFFAGIGVWSYALRQAGWPDDRPVWTGSCPCQPFSTAGKRAGFDDERHLWPAWYWLICQCRPHVVFGEQVADGGGRAWIDLVQVDLENAGFAFAPVGLCAAGFGAPHGRHRVFFVGHALDKGSQKRLPSCIGQNAQRAHENVRPAVEELRSTRFVSDTQEQPERPGLCAGEQGGERRRIRPDDGSTTVNLGQSDLQRCEGERVRLFSGQSRQADIEVAGASEAGNERRRPGPLNGFWANADWLRFRDGKWRPVEAGHVKMVDGSASDIRRVLEQKRVKDEEMRNMLEIRREDAQSPCGPQPHEQQRIKFDDIVPVLSSSLSLAKLYGDRETEEALLVLLKACCEVGNMRYPLIKIQEEIWPSIGEEAKSRIRMGFNAARWRIVDTFPLGKGEPERVGRIHAYGDAIVAPVAVEFIKAYMETATGPISSHDTTKSPRRSTINENA